MTQRMTPDQESRLSALLQQLAATMKENPVPKFMRGDVVQLNLTGGYRTGPASLPAPYGPETRYVVESGGETALSNVRVSIEGRPELGSFGGYYVERFKEAGPKREATAMTLEMARAMRQKLLDAGVPTEVMRIRSRSWDREGLYFAIDIDGGEKLYTPKAVENFITSRAPIDVTPHLESTRMGTIPIWQFRVGATGADPNGTFLVAGDGSYWWSEADIRKVGGIAQALGRRYRLGRQVFTPFV